MDDPRRHLEVELPIGYEDAQGRRRRIGALRKMTGHEEALLHDRRLNAGQFVTQLLACCLVRLEDLEPVGVDIVAALYTPDRNYLLLELRRFTLGDRMRALYRCPQCRSDLYWIEDLSRIEVRRLGSNEELRDVQVSLDDGYLDRRGIRQTEVSLGLTRGLDEELIAPEYEKDSLLGQDVLLLRCIKRFGSLPTAELEAYGIKILRDLTMGDRQALYRALDDQPLGVDLQRDIRCEHCGARFREKLNADDFFFAAD